MRFYRPCGVILHPGVCSMVVPCVFYRPCGVILHVLNVCQRPSRVDPNLDSYLIRSGLQNISIKYEGDHISCKKRQVVCLDAINMSNHYALHFSVWVVSSLWPSAVAQHGLEKTTHDSGTHPASPLLLLALPPSTWAKARNNSSCACPPSLASCWR